MKEQFAKNETAWRAFRADIEPELAVNRPANGTTVCAAREPAMRRAYGKPVGRRGAKRRARS